MYLGGGGTTNSRGLGAISYALNFVIIPLHGEQRLAEITDSTNIGEHKAILRPRVYEGEVSPQSNRSREAVVDTTRVNKRVTCYF